jgi:type I restriction enzyme S subunit
MENTFLKYSLMSNFVRERVIRKGSGSTVEGIQQSQFRKIPVTFPASVDEQTKITAKLVKADKRLEQEDDYLNKLSIVKKGLMQDLLTGKVRVN